MQIKQLFSLKTLWYLAFAAFFAYVLPITAVSLHLSDLAKVGYILFGADALYAIFSGLFIGKSNHSWLFLLFFPILYLFGVHFFFDFYSNFFVLVYLLFSFLAYGTAKD